MNKRRKSEHGAITVFLAGALVIIIAFMGMLVDLARMRVADAQAKRAAQLSLDAVMTQYSRRLREDYGLFGYSGGDKDSSNGKINATFNEYMNANLEPDAEEESDEFLKLIQTITGKNKVAYGDMLNMYTDGTGTAGSGSYPLSDPDVMYQQIMEFSKYRVPINMAVSGTLDFVTEFTDKVKQVENDVKALELISKLAEPSMQYYFMQDELASAVEALNKAIEKYQTAVDDWNKLVNGEQNSREDKIEMSGQGKGVNLERIIAVTYYDELLDCDYITGNETEDGYFTPKVSLDGSTPYDLEDTLVSFEELSEAIVDDAVEYMTSDFEDTADTVISNLEIRKRDFEQDAEDREEGETDYSDFHIELVDTINGLISDTEDMVDALKSNAEDNADEIAQMACNSILPAFREGHKYCTDVYKEEYDQAKGDLDKAIANVNKAIENLKKQAEKVKGSISDIDGEITSQKNKGDISDGIADEWNGDKGDKATTEAMLENDRVAINNLEVKVKALTDALNGADGTNSKLDSYTISLDFVNNGVIQELNGKKSQWQASVYRMSSVTFDGEYTAARQLDPEEFADLMEDSEEKDDKAKEALEEMENSSEKQTDENGNERESEQRYNSNKKIPKELKQGFVAVGESEDKAYKNKIEGKKPKDVSSDEAVSVNSDLNEVLGGLMDALNGGLQNILGTVYCSEYILNMFSNAAPAQSENEYNADDFEYARVVNLRNEYVTGAEMYDKLPEMEEYAGLEGRLGYFYNAEVEYILFGKEKEQSNVTHAQIMLQAILTVSNYLQVRRNTILKTPVEAAAAAGASIGIPPCVTRFLLYMVFAVTESQFDMFYLMRGYEIPMFSMDGDKLFMMNLDDPNGRVLNTSGELMVNYEFYLRLRLMIALATDRDTIMNRLANLMQLNINYAASEDSPEEPYPSDADFRMSGAYTTFNAEVSARMPYWFMTMAMMGEARQDESGYGIPAFEIVSSY